MSILNDNCEYWSLRRNEYLAELPEGSELLKETFTAPQQPESPCAGQISALVEGLKDLVGAISSNNSGSKTTPETFGVREAADKMGCSPQQVRRLVHEGTLQHHRQGKNLRFRQTDLEQFWTSQTRLEAGIKSLKKSPESCESNMMASEGKVQKKTKTSPIPTRKEVDRLWQS